MKRVFKYGFFHHERDRSFILQEFLRRTMEKD